MLIRKAIIAAVVGAASLMAAPAAMAAAPSRTISAPAAAHLTAASNPVTAGPLVTAAEKWLLWGSYSTLKACNSEGTHLVLIYSIVDYNCVHTTVGDYFVWNLWVLPGHAPGG
jgi:hypothetical protein